MSQSIRSVLLALSFVLATSGCVAAAPGGTVLPLLHPGWQAHMASGLDSWEVGDAEAAADHYRRALGIARSEALAPEELAYSSYRLAEAIRLHPSTSRGESALALLDESRRHFEAAYGTEHPVLIPVWVRLAELRSERGDEEGARSARAAADRIAVRFFPESHFLRERYGAARPALMMHPLEVLQLIGGRDRPPEQVVQGP